MIVQLQGSNALFDYDGMDVPLHARGREKYLMFNERSNRDLLPSLEIQGIKAIGLRKCRKEYPSILNIQPKSFRFVPP